MATIKDVAKAAGVSVATVSRVLNQEDIVVSETAERVRQAIRDLNYSPNMLGNSLRKRQTKNILVLLPTLSNQFFSGILRGIEQEAKIGQYNVMICMTDGETENEEKYLTLLKTKLADGVIFLSSTLTGKEMNTLAKRYPVVQCCEYVPDSHTSYVAIDNEQAGYDAVSVLIQKGHRNIAFLGAKGNLTSSNDRQKGYLRALQDHALPIKEEYMISDSYSFKSGMRSAKTVLNMKERPTAVFAVADSIALGFIRGLHDAGVCVPKDIAVIGFDNIAVASVVSPALSTVAQPQIDLGRHTMRLLANKIQNIDYADRDILLPHNFILRETV